MCSMYSMDDLSRTLNVSKQSLYKLIKNNQELSTIINQHSTTIKRKIFYDDEVLKWFARYYRLNIDPLAVSNAVGEGISVEENEIIPDNSPSIKITELETQIEALEARLKACEEEKKRLFEENGALLLTISQMSNTIAQMTNTAFQQYQASVKMLPPPRQSILKRLKAALTGKNREEPQNAPESPQNAG